MGCWPVHSTARIPLGRFKIIGAESQTGKNCASALALDDFHPSHNCPAVTIGPPFPSTKQIRSVVKRPKFVGRCLGPGRARKFHTHWHARTAKKTYQMCNIQKDHRAPGVLPADLSTFTHANNRATWTSPPQLLLVYRKDAQTQRVGRARSPLRAGVGHADSASGARILPSAPLRARLRRAPLLVEKSPDTLHPPCGHCGQDGRAPISAQRRRESVGRVLHVRDAPPSVHPETSGGQRTARPTNPVVTERATLGRSKFCIEEQGFVRAGCCARSGYTKLWTTRKSSINRTKSGAGAPHSKNFSSNPSQQKRRE